MPLETGPGGAVPLETGPGGAVPPETASGGTVPPESSEDAGAPRLSFARLVVLWLVAADLRIAILALPPVLPAIHRQLHLSETAIGLLTTLPVLLLGLGSVGGSAAVARLGSRRTLVGGLLVIAVATGVRGAGGEVALFGGSVLLGLGIATMQPALPTTAQAWFKGRVGFATAVYGNGFIVGEALAAALTLPFVVPLTGSWQGALAAWGLPSVLAAMLLLLPIGTVPVAPGRSTPRWNPRWREPQTWRLGLFQGGGSVVYFGTNAFLPTELHAVGHPSLVAPCLAALNITQLLAAFVVAFLARRGASPRPLMATCGVATLVGLALVAFWPGPLAIVGCAIVGLSAAIGFVVALALPPLLSAPGEVHRLSAGMFSIGYVLAFALPLLGGFAWDATGQPRMAFLPAVLGAVLLGTKLLGRRRGDGTETIARLR